ncbi:hypothetical protein ACFPOI_49725 [Nonomuraea angiospora]|uniref:Uncharacterized protein n=1 Tax=Nonomuraea angiospora TaxID=46172 RepID=A0ABR9LWR2_9ACTN|nr:hypothetical protein [Nonomuraea angiospora]MBE1585083.1 hypothetical protein [Nonomuraea angiospora]
MTSPSPGDKNANSGRPKITIAILVTTAIIAAAAAFGEKIADKVVEFISRPPKVTLSAVEDTGECINSYVFKKPMSQVPVFRSGQNWTTWGESNGGVVADFASVTVNVAGENTDKITITGIRFFVVKRRPPIEGAVVRPDCGGAEEAAFVRVNLDKDPPEIASSSRVPSLPGGADWKVTPITFPWTVSNTDTLTLLVYADATDCYCTWRGELSWQSGDSHGTLAIDNNGKPFEITSSSESKRYIPNQGVGWTVSETDERPNPPN